MKLPAVPACYYDRNGRLIDEPRKLPRFLRMPTHGEELARAREWASLALWCDDQHARIARIALDSFGSHGALVSGVVRDHFPDDVKATLRSLAHHATAFWTVASVHQRLSRSRSHPLAVRTRVYGMDPWREWPTFGAEFYARVMMLTIDQYDAEIGVRRIA